MALIPLTKGFHAIVDDGLFDYLSSFKWTARTSDHSGPYAMRMDHGECIYMHRLIAMAKKGQKVDHDNGNTLDNRSDNLRVCTSSQNQMNSKASKNGTKGVHFCKRRSHLTTPWQAYITKDRKRKHIGYFSTSESAQAAYNEACIKEFGEFARPIA